MLSRFYLFLLLRWMRCECDVKYKKNCFWYANIMFSVNQILRTSCWSSKKIQRVVIVLILYGTQLPHQLFWLIDWAQTEQLFTIEALFRQGQASAFRFVVGLNPTTSSEILLSFVFESLDLTFDKPNLILHMYRTFRMFYLSFGLWT